MTWTVAQVAVATGIPPSELLADDYMLRAIVAVLSDQARQQQRAARGR